ncbi:thioredoxin family protein [bacterium]|nr:thioredoxin family protein [bacterium]
MAVTPSLMIALGTLAPAFSLPDVSSGGAVSLDDYKTNKAMLVVFVSRHCPYVVHVREGLAQLGRDYAGKDIGIVAISANDASAYPDDAPGKLKEMAAQAKFTFPLLYDESQKVAIAYGARCTPDFFLFDKDRKLVYRGQLDDSRPGSGVPVTGKDLRAAIDAVLAGTPVSQDQKPSMGCNIKWKPGNEPK